MHALKGDFLPSCQIDDARVEQTQLKLTANKGLTTKKISQIRQVTGGIVSAAGFSTVVIRFRRKGEY
jgi:hypothetical protein